MNDKLPLVKYRILYEKDLYSGSIDKWPPFPQYLLLKEGLFIGLLIIVMLLSGGNIGAAIVVSAFGFMLPDLKRKELSEKRFKSARREMVPFLDMVSMMLESGVSLLPSLKKYRERTAISAFGKEIAQLTTDLEMGLTREESFARLQKRLPVEEVTEWVSTVLQAEKTGSPLSDGLRQLSFRLRTQRLQKAEKLAYEAPVKLLGPLAVFIFPVIFIVLLGPIILRFIYGE
jgi:tight adherence protein C